MTIATIDPVCGMEVAAEATAVTLTHRGITYRFCCTQCMERFQATPALYTGSQRSTDIQPMPKQRHLRITAQDADTLSKVEQRIRSMMGVQTAAATSSAFTVAYDLRIVTLAQIERALSECGVVLRGGLHGWRRALWRFAESNESENAAQAGTGACCSRPPPRLR